MNFYTDLAHQFTSAIQGMEYCDAVDAVELLMRALTFKTMLDALGVLGKVAVEGGLPVGSS